MDGLLLIDKPKGWTSFDAVNYVRSIVARAEGTKPRKVKVGHTGTLDPMATGLLVLCIGRYTKKVSELITHDKTYEAQIMFGARSTTGDAEGELDVVIAYTTQNNGPTKKQLEHALMLFTGEIDQVPHKFSAIKVGGTRAYELARAGKEVKLQSRKVTVYSIDVLDYSWPVAHIRCKVSSGTYIRVLAEDIGAKLGVGAYLKGLRRTEVDVWNVQDAIDPKSITIDNIENLLLA